MISTHKYGQRFASLDRFAKKCLEAITAQKNKNAQEHDTAKALALI